MFRTSHNLGSMYALTAKIITIQDKSSKGKTLTVRVYRKCRKTSTTEANIHRNTN